MNEMQIARANLVAAERNLELAKVDGYNVHGAISAVIGAQAIYDDARLNNDDTLDSNVKYLLDSYPQTIHLKHRDGSYSLIDSLAATFIQLRETAQASTKRERVELMEVNTLTNILAWVDSRISAEVSNRPDTNVHKEQLARTWGQVREFIVGQLKIANQ